MDCRFVGFFWIAFNYDHLPQSLNFAANEWAQSIRIDLHIEGWSVNWIEQKFSASGLTIRVPGEVVANQLADELGAQGATAAGAVAEGLIDAVPVHAEGGTAEGQPNVLKRVGSKIGTTSRNVWRKITGKNGE